MFLFLPDTWTVRAPDASIIMQEGADGAAAAGVALTVTISGRQAVHVGARADTLGRARRVLHVVRASFGCKGKSEIFIYKKDVQMVEYLVINSN
jgi:hypothetical protein